MSKESITIRQAREIILAAAPKAVRSQCVALDQALGRIAAEPVRSACPLPNYTNSAMDGYAFAFGDLPESPTVVLPLVGHSFAGAPCTQTEFAAGCAIEITTGAALPEAFDTVIPYEDCTIDEARGTVSFEVSRIKSSANVRRIGEQIACGAPIVEQGERVSTRHIALMAAAGVSQVTVFERVRAAVIATGSELVDPGRPLGRYQIYNSNALMLKSVLEAAGCVVQVCSTLDEAQTIADRIADAVRDNDIVLLSGGAGNGRYDLSQAQLESMGRMEPWSINMRPGRPMRFGQIDGKPVFVLPGNPVAAFVTCLEFVFPALGRMQGAADGPLPTSREAILGCDVRKKSGRAEFMRARIAGTEQGLPVVEPVQSQSSADLIMLAQADVILCLDHEPAQYAKGERVSVQFLSEAGL